MLAGSADGRFRDISPDSPALTQPPGVYRGMAWGDLDNDGAVDLVVTSIEGPVKVLKNIAPKKGHWLGVRAIDPKWKRDAIGARITLQLGVVNTLAWSIRAKAIAAAATSRSLRPWFSNVGG